MRIEQESGTGQVLALWKAAGLPLGHHTWSHMNLNPQTLDEWEDHVVKGGPALRKEMQGADWRWLPYPNLAEGDTTEKRPLNH
jgi:peptidoglycan/xylan/chitin deacetylase (PgdA/CDA1 family)